MTYEEKKRNFEISIEEDTKEAQKYIDFLNNMKDDIVLISKQVLNNLPKEQIIDILIFYRINLTVHDLLKGGKNYGKNK